VVYKVVKYGHPVLEQKADPVTKFATSELRSIVDDMFETMYEHKGVGLAAPQVNLSQRITVIDVSAGEEPDQKLVIINPQIIKLEGTQVGEEGCLSIPGFREDVKRAMKAHVRFQDTEGEFHEVTGEELLARALQHEIDHLNGVLFLSHLSLLKRDLIRRKIRRLQKAGEWE
jgi:peptide deformylase